MGTLYYYVLTCQVTNLALTQRGYNVSKFADVFVMTPVLELTNIPLTSVKLMRNNNSLNHCILGKVFSVFREVLSVFFVCFTLNDLMCLFICNI